MLLRYLIKTNVISFYCFSTKTKQITLVFEWLKTKQIKANIFFRFITKTKQITLVFDWLKTKQIKTNIFFGFITKTKLT